MFYGVNPDYKITSQAVIDAAKAYMANKGEVSFAQIRLDIPATAAWEDSRIAQALQDAGFSVIERQEE